jgi:hypothetical protein
MDPTGHVLACGAGDKEDMDLPEPLDQATDKGLPLSSGCEFPCQAFKYAPQRQLYIEVASYAGDHLRCHERMAAEHKEIILSSDVLDSEQFFENSK